MSRFNDPLLWQQAAKAQAMPPRPLCYQHAPAVIDFGEFLFDSMPHGVARWHGKIKTYDLAEAILGWMIHPLSAQLVDTTPAAVGLIAVYYAMQGADVLLEVRYRTTPKIAARVFSPWVMGLRDTIAAVFPGFVLRDQSEIFQGAEGISDLKGRILYDMAAGRWYGQVEPWPAAATAVPAESPRHQITEDQGQQIQARWPGNNPAFVHQDGLTEPEEQIAFRAVNNGQLAPIRDTQYGLIGYVAKHHADRVVDLLNAAIAAQPKPDVITVKTKA